MKRFYLSFLWMLFSFLSVVADNGTGFIGNGYYRVKNVATSRFIYVTDNTDNYDPNRDSEDFGAIQLWKTPSKAISDPGSVIYIKQVAPSQFDLMAQGTGIYRLVSTYVNVSAMSDGTYEVYASRSGVTKYLSDNDKTTRDKGKMGTGGKLTYRRWIVDRMDVNSEDNYFGISPTVALNGRYYHPFYAEFPFRLASKDMHAYYIKVVDGKWAVLQEIEGVIPTNTPVIISCASAETANNRLELQEQSPASISDNLLSGTYFANEARPKSADAYVPFDKATMRVLGITSEGKLGYVTAGSQSLVQLYPDPDDYNMEHPVTAIASNHSYLKVPNGSAPELTVLTAEEYQQMTTPKTYTVTYIVNGQVVYVDHVRAGDPIPSYKYVPEDPKIKFDGWKGDQYDVMPAKDIVYVAQLTVGINGLHAEDSSQSLVHDLFGRVVSSVKRSGIYIVNGLKVFIKP